jgi:UDP-N-acetylglucosamine 1-carboxyvinyltransferase
MSKIIIDGNKTLKGTIRISGAKNSAVAVIPAAILSDEKVVINNVPNISDIDALVEILTYLEVGITRKKDMMIIDPTTIKNKEIPEEISNKLRASYYFMASLLGKFKKVDMYFPGGCNIGKRPIDQTLKAFRLLGANVIEKDNKYDITANQLVGNKIILDMPSVGATVNSIITAVKAKGITVIENAAREPEIINVSDFFNKMGAKITGAGESIITIEGVDYLKGTTIDIIPDRIEAGTYVIIGSLIGNNLKIENVISEHIKSLLNKLNDSGANIKIFDKNIIVSKAKELKPIEVITEGYPGFPTDLQQPMAAFLTQCNGESMIEENIWENRFQNVEYLNKMGSNIEIDGKRLHIKGKTKLKGCEVKATDLRAGACMVIAGLVAEGKTIIEDIEHVLRGYEDIEKKLKKVGAKIKIIEK